MLKNYFLIAIRNFRRNKVFSIINILGLAIGISASLVIFLIIEYSTSFDKFHKDRERIYRVVSDYVFSGEKYYNGGIAMPLPAAVRREVTGIEKAIAFFTFGSPKVTLLPAGSDDPIVFRKEPNITFADDEYFNLFSYDWLAGSSTLALKEPFSVVLTASVAKKYFPHLAYADMIGRQINYDDSIKTKVTGIVEDLKQNTDFSFTQFISYSTIPSTGLKNQYGWDEWGSTTSSSQLFVKLTKGTTAAKINSQLKALLKKYRKDDKVDEKNSSAWVLQPISELHYTGHYGNFNDNDSANRSILTGLGVVALFLLLLGCINFINLTTAQASQRAREIGIRKAMGVSRGQLRFQILSETFFITFIATLLSIVLAPVLLKIFADFIPKNLHFNILKEASILWFLLGLTLVVTFISGFYPAIVLSRYNPAVVLKSQASISSGKTKKAWTRKTLTVCQFVIAQFFIMATLLVSKQIHYSLNKDLGFKKDAIVNFQCPYNDTALTKRTFLLEKLAAIPQIERTSLSNSMPASNNVWSSTVKYVDGKKEIESDVSIKVADSNFIPLYHLKLLAGTKLHNSDTIKEVLINETYARMLGFKKPEDAVNKMLEWNNIKTPVMGVIADFHQRSLHEPIKPMMMTTSKDRQLMVSVALKLSLNRAQDWKKAIEHMEKEYKQLFPEEAFDYSFYDKTIAKFYDQEKNISRLLTWATGLTILISCLGLLGLVIYISNQRTKEIGVRKVLGASIAQIVSLLSTDFLKLVILAFVIATPLVWLGINKWLEGYVYRTEISWWIFAISGIIMVFIALITLSIQTIRSATANPVNSLRTE